MEKGGASASVSYSDNGGGASQTNEIIKEKTPCALFDKMIVICWSDVSFEHVQKSCIMGNDLLV